MTRGRRTLLALMVVFAALASVACSDDEPSLADSTTSSAAEDPGDDASDTSSTEPADATDDDGSDTDESDTDDGDTGDTPAGAPLIDLDAITLVGHQMGSPADDVLADLIDRLGEPDHDSGWGPTECPQADNARFVAWSDGLRVYFSDDDGAILDGAAFDLGAGEALADQISFPDGIGWGDDIQAVAAHQNGSAEYWDGFGWWEVWVADPDESRAYLSTTDGPLDRVVVGYEPRCY